ncbi:DUF1173 family protein [Streptomyces luteireticuli]|uniref:DUF1173 family protein n=1 Tax=Streptomyces luteireticuli TaxID=173858 RepID=UPI0035567461
MPLAWLREHPGQAAPLFARAKAEAGHAWCLCRHPAPRLVIRCTRADRYHVAGWPGEGTQHATTCPFHKLPPGLSGRDRYSTHAIHETDDGVSIRLGTPLTRTLTGPRPYDAAPDEPHHEGASHRLVGLLGLLHWLWEEAHLNTWHPHIRRRTWHTCHAQLHQQTRETTVNGHPLHEVLHIVPPFTRATAAANNAALEALRARLGRHGDTEHRALLLGQVKDVHPTPWGFAYRLAHQRTALYARTALHERAARSYPRAFARTATEHGATRVALFVVERSPEDTSSPRCSPPPPTSPPTPRTKWSWPTPSSPATARSSNPSATTFRRGAARLRPHRHRPRHVRRGLRHPRTRTLRPAQGRETGVLPTPTGAPHRVGHRPPPAHAHP